MRRVLFFAPVFWGIASFGQAALDRPADHPVISEVRYFQHSGVNEEFVELHNPTSKPVFLSNWKLVYKTKTGTEWRTKVVFGPRHVLKPHGYFLWGGAATATPPDTAESNAQSVGLSNTAGNLALRDTAGRDVDRVAWGGGDSPEGTALTGKTVEGGSIERKAHGGATALSMSPGGADAGAGNGFDSDNNATDFVTHNRFAETNPQNASSVPEPEGVDPMGCGTCEVAPVAVPVLGTVSLEFRFLPDAGSTVCAVGILVPPGWQWSFQADDVDLEGDCFEQSSIVLSGDTVRIAGVQLSAPESGTVTLRSLVVPAMPDSASFPVFTAGWDGELAPIALFPKVSVQMEVIPISLLHRNDGQGLPAPPFTLGTPAQVSGTITAGHDAFSPVSTSVFVQDSTGGLCLYSPTAPVPLVLGDSITVSGVVGQYRGMTELVVDWSTLEQHGKAAAIPDPKVITCSQLSCSFYPDGSEPDEGRLVRILHAVHDPEAGTLSDGTGVAKLFLDAGTSLAVPSGAFHAAGILKQYKPGTDAPPYTSDYEIVPRFQSDFEPLAGPQFLSIPEVLEAGPDRAKLGWTTDQPASWAVSFGIRQALSDTVAGSQPEAAPRVELADLEPGTVYWFSVRVWTENGQTRSAALPFITASHVASSGRILPLFNGSVASDLADGITALGNQDLIGRLVQRIDSARFSIDMCFMKLDDWNVQAALVTAVRRGVRIRFVCDDEYRDRREMQGLEAAGVPVIGDRFGQNDGEGRMHNKFAVFDHRDASSFADDWVWTGSFNLTYYGDSPPAIENVVTVQDQALAEVYTREFEEMWGSTGDEPSEEGSRFGVRKSDDIPHRVWIRGSTVDVFMSPTDRVAEQVVKAIGTADSAAYFCQFSFTVNDLALALAGRKQAVPGFDLRGVMDATQIEEDGSSSEWNFLSAAGDVWLDGEPGILHHKYLLVDAGFPDADPLVATGSYNWTNKAEYANDENLLILRDPAATDAYLQEFAARYRTAGGQQSFRTGIHTAGGPPVPLSAVLFPNFPNPFNAETMVRFAVEGNAFVNLSVFDVTGRRVACLSSGKRAAGVHSVHWDGTGEDGSPLPSGLYMIRLEAGDEVRARKAALLR